MGFKSDGRNTQESHEHWSPKNNYDSKVISGSIIAFETGGGGRHPENIDNPSPPLPSPPQKKGNDKYLKP